MAKIKHLTTDVIAMIAAGEVAERPSQIIKELIENSLDANAKRIEINLENSGLDLISITDDGDGMCEEDLRLCWNKHTTSKIVFKEDLESVLSFGFRGEALSSIAGVCKLTIQSRERDESSGYKILIENGKQKEAQPFGTPIGTTVVVENLFAEVPARKKFLNNSSLELKKIIDVVTQIALINQNVTFSVFNNGKNILNTGLSNKDLLSRISYLLGNQISSKLVEINSHSDQFSISGFISKPQLSRRNKNYQFLYVNGRSIADSNLSKIIKLTYGSLLEPHAQPIFVLDIKIEPKKVDVNIHPHKRKVEFLDKSDLIFYLQNVVEKTLADNDLTYTFDKYQQKNLVLRDRHTIAHTRDFLKESTQIFNVKEFPVAEEIIQIDNTYLIYQSKDGLAMIDQHAAHERILFAQFKDQFINTLPQPVKLEKMLLLDLSLTDLESLKVLSDFLNKLGFKYVENNNKIHLSHVPQLFLKHDYLSLITELLDNYNLGSKDNLVDSQTLRVLNFLACRNAIMAGEYLTMAERRNLIEKLDATTGAYTCPHGRPVRVVISVTELEKLFLRK
ncbi:MAG: DNA mismatch repair endonuclease MutL [Candidatus Pacebacteria bacterium]|nr:DNA mismatch repair endonuclease MutL [Candidatus Paceibacterota bacterium]